MLLEMNLKKVLSIKKKKSTQLHSEKGESRTKQTIGCDPTKVHTHVHFLTWLFCTKKKVYKLQFLANLNLIYC